MKRHKGDTQMNIETYRLNQSKGQFSENLSQGRTLADWSAKYFTYNNLLLL